MRCGTGQSMNFARREIMRTFILTSLGTVGLLAGSTAVSRSHPPTAHETTATSPLTLKQDMRKLWTDHVVWTRNYIIAAVGDQPDQQAAAARLMKNQEDIGGAIASYYGKPAGDKLTSLLKEHITIATDLIKAAKAGDADAKDKADKKWHANAEDIAEFLSRANPNWPKATLTEMMNTHLSTTTNEVVARLNKNWDEDVRAYDAVYDHIF